MKNQRDHVRYHLYLVLALGSLIGAVAMIVAPTRHASAQAVTPSWSYTGSLNTARFGHTATLLPNGKVLVVGGSDSIFNGAPLNSAELYDPATGTWAHTGNLNTARAGHTATLLPNGKVLVAGGSGDCVINVGCSFHNSAELYDPTMGTWSITGSLSTNRRSHTATMLPGGKVLVVAGGNDNCVPFCSILNSAELYDPATGTWSNTGSLDLQRSGHTATLLPNGKVLVTAGFDDNTAELYDPATGTWSRTGNLNRGRLAHTAILLPNGDVLVAGGIGNCDSIDCYPVNSAELYDLATGTWSNTGNLNTSNGPATLLSNGNVLIVGGDAIYGYGGNSTEMYDPATATWSSTAGLNTARTGHTVTILPNGKVLVVGGSGDNSAELYDPGTSSTPNQIEDVQFFVRQQYLDFLGREPDQIGFQNWVNTLVSCPNGGYGEFDNPHCDRVHVSAGFYQSEEFQGRGFWAYRFYEVGLDRRPTFAEFIPDMLRVGGPQSPQSEITSKAAYTDDFVLRPEFRNRYDSLSNSAYLNALEVNAETTIGNKQALMDALNAGTKTRAVVLREVIESQSVSNRFFNRGFVSMQYFGYLRRDPDTIGFENWVNTLEADPNNFRHMIFGFIYSTEYRQRFGQP